MACGRRGQIVGTAPKATLARHCRASSWHRLQQIEGRPEANLHVKQAQEEEGRRFLRQTAHRHQFQTLPRRKSFDLSPKPNRKLNEEPAIFREVFADLREKGGKITHRGGELLLLTLEFCLDIRWVRQDKVELTLYARKHVTLLDRDVVQSIKPAILLSVPDRRRAYIDGYQLAHFGRTEHGTHTAPATEVQHPVTLSAVFGTSMLDGSIFLAIRADLSLGGAPLYSIGVRVRNLTVKSGKRRGHLDNVRNRRRNI